MTIIRTSGLFLALLISGAPVFAQEPSPAAAAQSSGPAGWKLGFGAEERVRVESRNNFDFDRRSDDRGGYIYQRLRVSAKAGLPGKYELFAEGLDLRQANYSLPKAAQEDAADLHQAYASVKGLGLDLPLELKVGRQELKYGKGRLVWAATWGNRINHLDAAVLKYKAGALSADAFYGARVSYDENGWNDPNRHDILGGVYAAYQKAKGSPLAEAYFLSNYDSSNMSTLNRRTFGLRAAFRLPGGVDCDLELPYQFGKTLGKDIDAYAFHFDASRGFKTPWSPRLSASFNVASGDRKAGDDKSNTFVPLYQSPHDPYGLMDLFRWQNMREAAVEVALTPVKGFKVIPAVNLFWLDNNHDSWYDSAGKKLRTNTTGRAGAYVGREASLLVKYDISDEAKFDAGYAHFSTGEYVEDTGAHSDADWMYFQLSLKI